MYLISLQRCYD